MGGGGGRGTNNLLSSLSKHFILDNSLLLYTGGFMKKVLSVYTHSMTTIYLSLSAQVAISTFFMKSPLSHTSIYIILFAVGCKRLVAGLQNLLGGLVRVSYLGWGLHRFIGK